MNDFGFTTLDEKEIESLNSTEDKARAMFNSIIPLLENLKKDTGKDYIYWPGRQKKIEEFQKELEKLLN
jgi:predicted butyrate kinase (DUF1464 family)